MADLHNPNIVKRANLDSEVVRLECPLCEWTSETRKVDRGNPNPVWHAQFHLLRSYHDHYAISHRPRPRLVEVVDG